MSGTEIQPMLPIERLRREIAPGAVHLPDWLSLEQQREIVQACRGWAIGPVPIRHTRLPTGNVMSVQTVCLGWHWSPYQYTRTATDAGGGMVAPMPDWLVELGRAAVRAAYGEPSAAQEYRPDTALINFYDDQARMGMHQDKDERGSQPVVSLSIGDTAVFRFGNTVNRNRPYTDVELLSGDLFVFGGPSRFAYHGVPKVLPGSADPGCGLPAGRLNLTLRMTGLTD
ncbi:MAG TPA: alpha-ketoglutarate-dependent dioxygenase AlkB [Kineosporiaceae bacterium]|nr:alpha-ketoglutarate-dependent dioxygenase AlkB [Kineosporiaceae bacterium]